MSIPIKQCAMRIPDILLPNASVDLFAWSVIACDQFTSNAAYWNEVATLVGSAPSTLRLMLPEIYLHDEQKTLALLTSVKEYSNRYRAEGLFVQHSDCLLLIKRTSAPEGGAERTRTGIMVQVDLSQYDPDPASNALIKATEAIVPSRLVKRIEVRKQSSLDFSHVLMLYSDPAGELVRELVRSLSGCLDAPAYQTNLMLGGGRIEAMRARAREGARIIQNFFTRTAASGEPLLAVGDGNHSLMAAKQAWLDAGGAMDHPDRWALVELVNIFDPALAVEPIHRTLDGVDVDALFRALGAHGNLRQAENAEDVPQDGVLVLCGNDARVWTPPQHSLAVEALETLLQKNDAQSDKGALYKSIDFIHDAHEVKVHARSSANAAGFLFPEFDRSAIFRFVRERRLFPRKSFSLGASVEKRYYIEACDRSR